MQQNRSLWLVVLLLGGAFTVGNPFLPARGRSPAPENAPAARWNGVMRGTPALTPAIGFVPVALRAGFGDDPRVPLCPDPALQPLVVSVGRDLDGEPIWLLRDGRRLRLGPEDRLVAVER